MQCSCQREAQQRAEDQRQRDRVFLDVLAQADLVVEAQVLDLHSRLPPMMNAPSSARTAKRYRWMMGCSGNEKPNISRRYYLRPWYKAKKSERTPKNAGAIYVQDVIRYRLEYAALLAAMENFRRRLLGRKPLTPESDELARPPPTIPQIQAQVHRRAGCQPAPSRRSVQIADPVRPSSDLDASSGTSKG